MITKIKKIENLDKYPDKSFIYFDYNGREEKTIISKQVLDFIKCDLLNVGDKINIQKGYHKDKPKYLVTRRVENGEI